MTIHLAGGIALHDGKLLMVASHYRNHAQPLWNLPGGRQCDGELLFETVQRELLEETGLRGDAGELAYVSESYDNDVHYLNATFLLTLQQPSAPLRAAAAGDHVVAAEWVCLHDVRFAHRRRRRPRSARGLSRKPVRTTLCRLSRRGRYDRVARRFRLIAACQSWRCKTYAMTSTGCPCTVAPRGSVPSSSKPLRASTARDARFSGTQ